MGSGDDGDGGAPATPRLVFLSRLLACLADLPLVLPVRINPKFASADHMHFVTGKLWVTITGG
jgi:hypothetical protein